MNDGRNDALGLLGHGTVNAASLLFGLPAVSGVPELLQALGRWHERRIPPERDRALREAATALGLGEPAIANAQTLLDHAKADASWIAYHVYGCPGGLEAEVIAFRVKLDEAAAGRMEGRSALPGQALDRAAYDAALGAIAVAYRTLRANEAFLRELDEPLRTLGRAWQQQTTSTLVAMNAKLDALAARDGENDRLRGELEEKDRLLAEAREALAAVAAAREAGTTGSAALDQAVDQGDPRAVARGLAADAREREGDALERWRQAASVAYWTDTTLALEAFRAVVRLDPNDFWSALEVGHMCQRAGSLDHAEEAYTEALRRGERSQAGRLRAIAQLFLADIAAARGDLEAAGQWYNEAVHAFQQLIEQQPDASDREHDLTMGWDRLGRVREAQGDLAGALDAYQASLAVRERLSSLDPKNAKLLRDLAISHERLGDVRRLQGYLPSALEAYRAGLDIHELVSSSDPNNAEWQRDRSVSRNRVGDVRRAQGNLAGALQSYEEGLAIAESLVSSDPNNAEWQRDLSVSWNKVGDVRAEQGDITGALKAYQAGLAIADRLAASDPVNAVWQRDLALSLERLGDMRGAKGDVEGALHTNLASLVIRERLTAADPNNAEWQRDLIISNVKLAEMADWRGDNGAAMHHLKAALAVADALARAGRLAPADAWMPDDLRRRLAGLKGD
ncbi:MAG: hypothetical protein AAFX81_17965 [Pseudomonadota bacterium]